MTIIRRVVIACALLFSAGVFAQTTFTVSVNVTGLVPGPSPGLAEFSVVMLNNSTSDQVTIFDNITAPLSTAQPDGTAYDVVIEFQPDSQTCATTGVTSGVIAGADAVVQVVCDPIPAASAAESVPVPFWVAALLALSVLGIGAHRLNRT